MLVGCWCHVVFLSFSKCKEKTKTNKINPSISTADNATVALSIDHH